MSRAIFEKPLSELTWSDFDYVVSNHLEESQFLEFKETLPERDGNKDSWQLRQNKIGKYCERGNSERGSRIRQCANAYGGMIIIGIADNKEKPACAKDFGAPLIRDCNECAERLGDSLRDIIEPPIAGFDLRAFPKPNGDGEGLIVLRVASSTQAPHGVGLPPKAFVRRGSVTHPLTMRDLHNLFWESRTSRERVREIRQERRKIMLELEAKKKTGRLIQCDGNPVSASQPHLMFRCSIIPEQSLGLSGIASALIRSPLARPEILTKGSPASSAFGKGTLPYGWRPNAHAAQADDFSRRMFSLWTIGDNGLVEAVGFSLGQESENKHYPGWFSVVVAQVLLMAEKLRLRAGRPDVPLAIDAQFLHDGTASAWLDQETAFYLSLGVPDENVKIGPFGVATRAEILKVHQEVEREIWFGLGVPRVYPAEPDFEAAFSSYLGAQAR
jgi:hypothetical protein